jgi:transcriptional regulator with XRE-family HTH domain
MSDKKTYDSVSAMVKDTLGSEGAISAAEFDSYVAERKLVKDLAILRSARGLSQEDVAKKLGCSQSWVSKLEHGTDDNLRIGDLKAYLSTLGLEFRPGAMKEGATLVDEIKILSFAIRQKLITFAELAKEGDGLAEPIARFLCEAFHNINRFLSEAAAKLPHAQDNKPYISIVATVQALESADDDDLAPCFRTKCRKNGHAEKEAALT